jgi:hypothetical protein
MSTHDPREAGLRRVVREARAEEPAEVDWDGLEERLMQRVRRSAPVAPRRSTYPLAWAGLAVAAAVSLWLVNEGASNSRPQPRPEVIEATEPLRKSGNALAVGTRVTADERELSVDHAGRATWTLATGSSAKLIENGERIALRLERGSVLSEVVPSPQPEAFVVEAAGARIAVHGTVFRVALDGERVIVQVREGTVAVGAIGAVPGFFLKAPAYGDFAADGRSGSIDGRPLGESEDRRAQPLKLGQSRPANPAPSSSGQPAPSDVELPNEPSISDIEAGIVRIVDATSDCFSRNTKSTEGVQITVRTALSLRIDPAGGVSDVDFQPPLSPDVEQCAAGSIEQVTFAASKQGAKVTRMLELKR